MVGIEWQWGMWMLDPEFNKKDKVKYQQVVGPGPLVLLWYWLLFGLSVLSLVIFFTVDIFSFHLSNLLSFPRNMRHCIFWTLVLSGMNILKEEGGDGVRKVNRQKSVWLSVSMCLIGLIYTVESSHGTQKTLGLSPVWDLQVMVFHPCYYSL